MLKVRIPLLQAVINQKVKIKSDVTNLLRCGRMQPILPNLHARTSSRVEDLQMSIFIRAAQKLVRCRRSLIIIGEHLSLAEKSTTNCKKCIQSHSVTRSQRVYTMRNLVRSLGVVLVESFSIRDNGIL